MLSCGFFLLDFTRTSAFAAEKDLSVLELLGCWTIRRARRTGANCFQYLHRISCAVLVGFRFLISPTTIRSVFVLNT